MHPSSPQSFEIEAGMVFTATDGPYKDQLMTIQGRDPKQPPEADRWQIVSPDGKV